MKTLISGRMLQLAEGEKLSTSMVAIDGATTQIKLVLRRPTSSAPLQWAQSAKLLVDIVTSLDGVESRVSGGTSGGIRVDKKGEEAAVYSLMLSPTAKLDPATGVTLRRLGQDAKTAYFARIEILAVGGPVETEILLAEAT